MEMEIPYKPIAILGGVAIALTMIGVIMACCTKMTMHCICVTLTMLILFVLSILLIVFGSILAVPGAKGTEYIDNNCNMVQTGNPDIDAYSKSVFEKLHEFDGMFAEAVTTQMCTEFCMCPGGPLDEHYKQYKDIDAKVYEKYGRSFTPQLVGNKDISLKWTFQKKDQPTAAGFESIASDNMLKCFENAQKIADKVAELKNDPSYAEQQKKRMEEIKPPEKFIKLISHIEDKYSCSGLCTTPLFYFTQSVTKGPPKTPCLVPLVTDIAKLL